MPKIIAEICQNHSGDKALVHDMIQAAKEAGADIIKGQIVFSEDLTPRPRFDTGHTEESGVQKTIHRPYMAEYERLQALDLLEEDYHFFVSEAEKAGLAPMLTVFARKRVPLAKSLPYGQEKLVKLASYDCASHVLINELADGFDNLVISTGATQDDEIKQTAQLLRKKNKPFVFLHCVTSYPNTLDMANLARLDWLRQFTPQVGWSDHTLVEKDGLKAAKTALMLGADYVERHFTILTRDKTKDGPVSINPAELKELADFAKLSKTAQKEIVEQEIPDWQIMLGQPQREMTHTEMLNRDYYRGRFASQVDDDWIYNWDEKEVF